VIGKKKGNDVKAFLGAGAEFEGKLVLSGSVRIDGNFKGEITGTGTLVIGECATVQADISIDNLLVFGDIQGSVATKNRVEISSSGRLSGAVATPVLIVEEGAVLDGKCRMKKVDEESEL